VTRDELIGKVAAKWDVQPPDRVFPLTYPKNCPHGILGLAVAPNRCREDMSCQICWATAIVNLVKGEEERR
jgi:hypothetical protein